MKAILQFTLPEEQEEFEAAQDGWKYRRIITDMDEHLRSIVKYGIDPSGSDLVRHSGSSLPTDLGGFRV